MRERLMTPGTAFIENGHINVRDQNGIVRWTSNPADRDLSREANRGFDINRHRLHYVERLIIHRYGGPVDTDDAPAYLSVAFNAIAMSRQLRGWSQSPNPLLTWARNWTPSADPAEVLALAQKVVAAPRRMTSRTVGKLVQLSYSEWEALEIRTIDPSDISQKQIETIKANKKRRRDKATKADSRRREGALTMDEIQATSRREFCNRHGLAERSFYRHQRDGDLEEWLIKKGISEKWQTSVATLDGGSTLIERQPSATVIRKPKSSGQRAALKPPRKTQIIQPATFRVPSDPVRRTNLARLFETAAYEMASHP